MFDLEQDDLITLTAAAAYLPGRPHISTLHRWRLRGVRGIRLETVMVGGRRYVTKSSLNRFVAATTQACGSMPVDPSTPKARAKAIEKAEQIVARQQK